jgi:hypothetical protein
LSPFTNRKMIGLPMYVKVMTKDNIVVV